MESVTKTHKVGVTLLTSSVVEGYTDKDVYVRNL